MEEFKVNSEQQSVIDLITTWKPKNVRIGIDIDKSLGLGVEEIYRTFINEINIFETLDEEYDIFPIESSLLQSAYRCNWVSIPNKFDTTEKVIRFIKKMVLLWGKQDSFVLQDWDLQPSVDWLKVIEEVNLYFKEKNFCSIQDVPF